MEMHQQQEKQNRPLQMQTLRIHPVEHEQQERQESSKEKREVSNNGEQYDSQFLELDPQMMKKLQKIQQSKTKPLQSNQKSNKNLPLISKVLYQEQQKVDESVIKKEFVHKLKQWDREKQQLKVRKQEIQQKKMKQKQQMNLRRRQQQQEEKEFLRLQKQKMIQQKIQQIEQRRQKREQSLKNAILKRSYNKIPSYAEVQNRYRQQQQQAIEINMRLMKDKKKLAKLDPEQLKLHQKAYIQRIKERLNMIPKSDRNQKAKSDFNLYLKRSEEKKRQEVNKIIKMKKYQEKINSIPIKIDQSKKQEKLIQIDKIKNPQKYRLLSQKLQDQQIYEQFKNFSINIDRKQLGINYLNQLKQSHEKPIHKTRKSNSQMLKVNPQQKLPNINKKHQFTTKTIVKQHQKTKSVEIFPSQAYRQSLDKNKQRDSRYMKALKQKLAMAIDM